MEELVVSLLENKNLTPEALKDAQRTFSKTHNLNTLPSKSEILQTYFKLLKEWKIEKNELFETVLRKRAIRSLSGIVPVQVLTKPFPCPSHCIFCPNDPEMPKSYIKSEPGAMRAWLNQFDPLKQVYNRLYSLSQTWHKTDKIEMIVLWWTWDFYPDDYKIEFIKNLYDACNTFDDLKIENKKESSERKYAFKITNEDTIKYLESLEEAITRNETAAHRIIWLTIETRPEFVTDENCQKRRAMGVTRIEMWVQSTDNEILDLNQRGHHIEEVHKALHKLRQYALKFSIHIMPWLYGSNVEKDIKTFKEVYSNPYLKPDEIKFYPTSVIPWTVLYKLYEEWKYSPITTEQISEIIATTFREIIPPYTRIKRLIRDIPATEIAAGSNITNLSQLMHERLLKEYKDKPEIAKKFYERIYENVDIFSSEEDFVDNVLEKEVNSDEIKTFILWDDPDLKSYRNYVSLDTRSREVRNKTEKTKSLNLVIRKYLSSVWVEYFISFEDELWYLYWFTRLLHPKEEYRLSIPWLWNKTALIRELHVYWALQWLEKNQEENNKVQHTWLWKNLLDIAEKLSKKTNFDNLSVISWVGVREYYRKQWYTLEGTYMLKKL